MTKYLKAKSFGLILTTVVLAASAPCQTPPDKDTLARAFLAPPTLAWPRVWWHWMNGNVTREGIRADLLWMHRVHIGGMQLFDINLQTPQVVPNPIKFMSPEWKEAFRYAATLADSLGLEMGMATSGGWSESGSPWVTPQEAMKRLVWSETLVQGGISAPITLPLSDSLYRLKTPIANKDSDFYRDIKVIAFPATDSIERVTSLFDKAQYRVSKPDAQRTPPFSASGVGAINSRKILDLTPYLQQNGILSWSPLPGSWKILRVGYTLTGRMDRFGTTESHGLEVDKLSREYTDSYLEQYAGRIRQALGPYFGRSFQYFLMDSWEVGNENWTDSLIPQFRRRRDYDPTPFLPVLTGYLVGSPEISDRFLWDFRRTLADLVAEAHYGEISRYCVSNGLKGVYAEAIGVEQPTTGDGLQAKGQVAVPMGEFVLEPWRLPGGRETNRADLKEAASAAHIYGKSLAAAEAFTTTETDPWAQAPYDLKPYADWAFSLGINQFVIHTSAHQPFTDSAHQPGITLSTAGQNYNRNNTWAEQSIAFNDYLARCSYLLQQGRFVADVLYYYGEDAPVVVPYWKSIEPHLPPGYDCDWINTEMLLKATQTNGRLTLPDGMSYRLLVVPNDVTRLTLPVVRKLRDLVVAGATLLAPHPGPPPSLTDYPLADDSTRYITDSLWGPYGGFRRYHEKLGHPFGKGIVYTGLSIQDVFDELNLCPDLRTSLPDLDDTVVWTHRSSPDADIYFIANQQPHAMDFQCQFRVGAETPEFWDPADASIRPASFETQQGRTIIPIHLDPRGSIFVLFRAPTSATRFHIQLAPMIQIKQISGPWRLQFQPHRGAPATVTLDSLISWPASSDVGVRYFSGTATYKKDIDIPASWLKSGRSLCLDLGAVKEIAEVYVNGRKMGILWKPPYRVAIQNALKPGLNHLEIQVTNLWPNRLIGDEQLGATRYTFTIIRPFKANSALLGSGLLGPVRIYSVSNPAPGKSPSE